VLRQTQRDERKQHVVLDAPVCNVERIAMVTEGSRVAAVGEQGTMSGCYRGFPASDGSDIGSSKLGDLSSRLDPRRLQVGC
jgi:hypothetical protein